jgi:protein ImuB
MKKRIVSIWFPRLATDRIQRQRGAQWAARPLAAVVEAGNRIMLAGINRAAEQAGLAPGMTLADARAVAAHLATVPADARAQAALLARLARWGARYTPIAAPDGVDGLFLDITGCAHLFGGEADMLADMTGRLEGFGFAVTAGLADTPGAAWALARYGGSGTIARPGGTARALERLPVGALRLDREVAASLAHLGLRRIGDLYGMPRGSLAARFGQQSAPGRHAARPHRLRRADRRALRHRRGAGPFAGRAVQDAGGRGAWGAAAGARLPPGRRHGADARHRHRAAAARRGRAGPAVPRPAG